MIPEDWDFRKLKTLREEAGIDVPSLAHACGVWPATVYNWESGRSRPNIRDLLLILRALQCDFWDLMPDD